MKIVKLKKAKLTASIINQMEDLSFSNLDGFRALGWCNFKPRITGSKLRSTIILHNAKTNEFRKHYIYNTRQKTSAYVEIDEHGTRENHFFVELRSSQIHNMIKLHFETRETADAMLIKINRMYSVANKEGQFYI